MLISRLAQKEVALLILHKQRWFYKIFIIKYFDLLCRKYDTTILLT